MFPALAQIAKREGGKSDPMPRLKSSSICLFIGLLLGLFSFCECAAQTETQAILIEADQDSMCYTDCPIIPLPNIDGFYVFCFRAGDTILVGQHQAWEIGLTKLASMQEKTLALRYDDLHLWVKLPSGWQVNLNRFYGEYFFKDLTCRDAAQTNSFEHGITRPAPVPGEPAEPVLHGKKVYGWTLCSAYLDEKLVPQDGLFLCTVWDLKGEVRRKATYKQIESPEKSTQIDAWDNSVEGVFKVLHLRQGRTLKLLDFIYSSPLPSVQDNTKSTR